MSYNTRTCIVPFSFIHSTAFDFALLITITLLVAIPQLRSSITIHCKMPKRKADKALTAELVDGVSKKPAKRVKAKSTPAGIDQSSAMSAILNAGIVPTANITQAPSIKVKPKKATRKVNSLPPAKPGPKRLSRDVRSKLKKTISFVESEQGKINILTRPSDRPELYEISESSLQGALTILHQEFEIPGPVDINKLSNAIIERRDRTIGEHPTAHYVLDLSKPTMLEAQIQEKIQGYGVEKFGLLEIELQMFHQQLENDASEGLFRVFDEVEMADMAEAVEAVETGGDEVNHSKILRQMGVCPLPSKDL